MATKLIFEYSEPLDEMLTEMSLQPFTEKQEKELINYKNKLEKEWQKIESEVINLIESFSKLKFKTDIHCYPIKNMSFKAISSPLIIKQEENIIHAKIILIHELIHRLFTQNKNQIVPFIAAIYPKKDEEFKIHIPVLTLQKKIMEELFKESDIKEFIKSHDDGLEDVWKEVNKHYHKFKGNIIKFLKDENLE